MYQWEIATPSVLATGLLQGRHGGGIARRQCLRHVDLATALDYCVAIAALPPRSIYFWILPVAVLGNSVTNVNDLGTLKCAMWSRTKARSSSTVALCPALSTTNACGASPHCTSDRPTTATSWTAG